ncbi:MAG: hypothetical protein J2P36_10015 [Ktedonobacteraceae bacterium]|nr:hypothetical protein [Ktedonobacteraceae bacterium]
MFARGPLCFLLGEALVLLGSRLGQVWINQLGLIILIASTGCFTGWGLRWLVAWQPAFERVRKLIPRLSWSVIGLGWLLYGIRLRDFFLLVFLPTPSPPTREPSLIEMLLGTLLPIVGIVIVVMMNADILAMPLTRLLRRVKSLAPISRTSLAYPLTFRFRTGVTMALLSLVVFLILLLVTNNLGAIQEAQVEQRTGNFHLLFGLVDKPDLVSDIKNQPVLRGEIAEVAVMHPLLPLPEGDQEEAQPARVMLRGHPVQATSDAPIVVDNTFLATNTMPLMARARGFTTDRQVWNAVRDHQGYAVMQYDTQLVGLPTSHGFEPFTINIPRGPGSDAAFQRVTVIGLVSNNTYWRAIYLSDRTGQQIVQPPFLRIKQYLIRVRPGFSAAQIAQLAYQAFPIPVIPVVLILAGSYLVAFVATFLPSRQASRVAPAEALRYE